MAQNRFTGFVRVEGDTIVDADGQPLLLRGIGLGNWLLPEGYMWKFPEPRTSPREIEERVEQLVGPERAADFWRRFGDTFINEADIAKIAELGYDHVRLPLNARYLITDDGEFLEPRFARIDDAIAWCRRHNLWLLLDLHGAPGGQTGTNIDDSANGKPELFMEQRYRDLTTELWRELARRYKSDTTVLGYDLLNEPLPNEWADVYGEDLAQLYRDLTAAIREIDTEHLLMYEGSHWATNFSNFDAVWDPNSVIHFHRYWCPTDVTSIQEYLDLRERLGVPIFMGEGGENNPEWINAMHRMYDHYDIGWNFWPWKKLDTLTSPLSGVKPEDWELVADPESMPDPETAWRLLNEYLVAMEVANCVENTGVIDAMFGRGPFEGMVHTLVPGEGKAKD